jgi:hypothetical protein
MSLKTFHIVFIVASTALCFWLGAWFILPQGHQAFAGYKPVGVIFLLTGIGLLVYGIQFLKKLKHVSFL